MVLCPFLVFVGFLVPALWSTGFDLFIFWAFTAFVFVFVFFVKSGLSELFCCFCKNLYIKKYIKALFVNSRQLSHLGWSSSPILILIIVIAVCQAPTKSKCMRLANTLLPISAVKFCGSRKVVFPLDLRLWAWRAIFKSCTVFKSDCNYLAKNIHLWAPPPGWFCRPLSIWVLFCCTSVFVWNVYCVYTG